MPDIDVDFCFERRDEVIRYVREKYGEDRVAQIITFGTLKGKQAIKDVGRVLDFTFAETDRIAKLYPEPKQGKDFPLGQGARDGAAAAWSCASRASAKGGSSTSRCGSRACCATPRSTPPASSSRRGR